MSRRLLIIIIAAAVLIGVSIAAFVIVNRSPALQNSVLKIANVNTNTSRVTVQNTNTEPTNTNTATAGDEVARAYVGRNFAEAFGSGSSEDNFSNEQKAKPFATDSFGAFLDRTLAQQKQINLAGPYHSFLTQSLVVTTTKISATTAAMTIGTQRQETIADETKVYYQDLLLDLVKVGADWKVNAASWKPR